MRHRIDAKVAEMCERGHHCMVTRRDGNKGYKVGSCRRPQAGGRVYTAQSALSLCLIAVHYHLVPAGAHCLRNWLYAVQLGLTFSWHPLTNEDICANFLQAGNMINGMAHVSEVRRMGGWIEAWQAERGSHSAGKCCKGQHPAPL